MKNTEYLSLGHAKTHLRYHIIFSTKYRKKCLNQIHDSVIEAFKKSEINSHYKILTMELINKREKLKNYTKKSKKQLYANIVNNY